jgi:hypothetical protein
VRGTHAHSYVVSFSGFEDVRDPYVRDLTSTSDTPVNVNLIERVKHFHRQIAQRTHEGGEQSPCLSALFV